MKKLCILLAFVLCLGTIPLGALTASAEILSGTCDDNITWSLDTETGVLTISGTGDMKNYTDEDSAPWSVYKHKIESVIINDGIISVGDYAFWACSNVASISLPNSLTSIGDKAFYNCNYVTEIAIPSNVTSIGDSAFAGCDQLASVSFHNGLVTIEDKAFLGTALTSVEIPASVESIGQKAFASCDNLTDISLPDKAIRIGIEAFFNTAYYTEPANWEGDVLYIGKHLIRSTYSISGNYEVKEGTLTIGGGAFESACDLSEISFPSSLVYISIGALANCYGIDSLIIPEGVTTIGEEAFAGCALVSVSLPVSLAVIEKNAFLGNATLDILNYAGEEEQWAAINIAEGNEDLTTLVSAVIYEGVCDETINWSLNTQTGVLNIWGTGELNSQPWKEYGEHIETLIIEEGITAIGDEAFEYCRQLESVTLPEGLTRIGKFAFFNCRNLTSINIPEGVTYIDSYAFQHCSSLNELTLPDSLYSAGVSAFLDTGCYNEANNWENGILYIGNHLVQTDATISGDVTIREGTRIIHSDTFTNRRAITSVTIPESVIGIGSYAFARCANLTSVYITDIAAWCDIKFKEYDSNPVRTAGNLYLNGELLTDLVIPDGVTSISDLAFINCDSIISVTIPDSVSSIGISAFYSCSNLTDLNMGNGVTILKEYAFAYCNGLQSVNLSKSLNTVESYAFGECENLATVTIPLSTTDILSGGFIDCPAITTVYYEGLESDWADINIKMGNETILEANIIFGSTGEDIGDESSEIDGESSEEADAIYGDVNFDDTINSLDAAQVLKHDAKLITLEGDGLAAADVNGDGTVNSLDAAQILKFDAKLITEF